MRDALKDPGPGGLFRRPVMCPSPMRRGRLVPLQLYLRADTRAVDDFPVHPESQGRPQLPADAPKVRALQLEHFIRRRPSPRVREAEFRGLFWSVPALLRFGGWGGLREWVEHLIRSHPGRGNSTQAEPPAKEFELARAAIERNLGGRLCR